MRKYLKIGLTALPIVGALSGIAVYLVVKMNAPDKLDTSINHDISKNNNHGLVEGPPSATGIIPDREQVKEMQHAQQQELNHQESSSSLSHHHTDEKPPLEQETKDESHSSVIQLPPTHVLSGHEVPSRQTTPVPQLVPFIKPGLVQYIPKAELHIPKKIPLFTPNFVTPSEIMSRYESITVFPEIQVSEVYKFIRIDYRKISINEKIISYVVGTAVKKAQISDGTISFGYQYLNKQKTGISISLFWSDQNGNVRKIKTYNIKLQILRY
ncbi:MAG: hypothetical protein KAG14_02970 [Mycoplasmataceae bacterium]|nr:hypothetical protein [Mycoplasmataceae bacterium]